MAVGLIISVLLEIKMLFGPSSNHNNMLGLFLTFYLRLSKVYGKSEVIEHLHDLRKKKEAWNSSLLITNINVDARREKKRDQGSLVAGSRRPVWLNEKEGDTG